MVCEIDCILVSYDNSQRFLISVNYGPWEDHVAECWKAKDQPNILFITYEELQQV